MKNPVDFIYPLVKTIWTEEQIPRIWNKGHITSLWKGKGDREMLTNHRGITTSSAIGTIVESLIDNRLEKLIPFTQAQGGGKKGASTCDHLFRSRYCRFCSLELQVGPPRCSSVGQTAAKITSTAHRHRFSSTRFLALARVSP